MTTPADAQAGWHPTCDQCAAEITRLRVELAWARRLLSSLVGVAKEAEEWL